ncbi:MAG: addiction module protein [Campylobacterales bacterium]|nr:addiction module protein [Campylobacterales bacterium]
MSINDILQQALQLKANERSKLVDELLKSLDKPDEEIEKIWADEAQKRLKAYREGKLKTVPMQEVFA